MLKRLATVAVSAAAAIGVTAAVSPTAALAATDGYHAGNCSTTAKGMHVHAGGYGVVQWRGWLQAVEGSADAVAFTGWSATPTIYVSLRHANGRTYAHWTGHHGAMYVPMHVHPARGDYLHYRTHWAVSWWPDSSCSVNVKLG